MKNIFSFLIICLSLGIALNSCEITPDLNISPNDPEDVSVNLLLPSAQLGTFFTYGDDNARVTSMWMQQHSGTDRQYIPIARYSYTEADVNSSWERAYADAMMDLNRLIEKSEAEESYHYSGIAKINMAMVLGVVTDLWNDVPYSDGFKGIEGVVKPTYDSQEAIYATIQSLLDEGIEDLTKESVNSVSSNDLIYGGNLDKWTACANVLKARYALHLSKLNGNAAYEAALTALDAGVFTGTADNAEGKFALATPNENFWFSFNVVQRPGYMSAGKYLVDLLLDSGDPRISSYFNADDADGGYSGSAPGEAEELKSTTGPAFASQDSPIPLVTFEEQKFIEAEAAFETGDTERAATAYNEAVTASIAHYGGSDSTYLANNANETAGSISKEKIMNQKYIALFTQIEVYNDWRRTGFPALGVAANAVFTEIPRRLVYPQSERLYNQDNTPFATATDRVWWDN